MQGRENRMDLEGGSKKTRARLRVRETWRMKGRKRRKERFRERSREGGGGAGLEEGKNRETEVGKKGECGWLDARARDRASSWFNRTRSSTDT